MQTNITIGSKVRINSGGHVGDVRIVKAVVPQCGDTMYDVSPDREHQCFCDDSAWFATTRHLCREELLEVID